MYQEMFLRKIPEDMRPWECNVNGVKYVYPAGTEQNVPAEVAAIIDAYWENQEADYPETGISFNDLRDKPFGESTEVLFDQRVEFVDMGNGMMVFDGEPPELLETGKTYTVTYNGEKYNCVAFDVSDDGTEVAIGNSVFFGMDTGEPFVISTGFDGGDIQEYFFSVLSINGDTSATVKIEKTVIHTIDPKFLPGDVVEIPITWNDDQDDFTVGKTFAEMREAIDSGSTVVLKDNLGSLYYLHGDEGEYLSFTNIVTNMNSLIVFKSFSFSTDGYERYYSEAVTTQENSDIVHYPEK